MIILFGLAGSGKGTQGKALAEIFGWRWISVGEAIRQTGEYDDIINGGNLISDEDVVKIMDKQIAKAREEGLDVILDGYPRDVAQAKYIAESMANDINGAIIIDVPKEELFERLALRGRDDDKTRESIENRFAVFDRNISEMLKVLGEKGIEARKVDGVGKVEEVTERLVKVVKELVPGASEEENGDR